jgi:hypothetical protein
LEKELRDGKVVFGVNKYENQFRLRGVLDTAAGKLPHAMVFPEAPAGKTFTLPFEKADKAKGYIITGGPPNYFKPEEGQLAYGVNMKGEFIVKGKKAGDKDDSYYWVQYVRNIQTISLAGKKVDDESVTTPWKLDIADKANKAMPNRYPIQNDLANHMLTDSPSRVFPFAITFVEKDKGLTFTLEQTLKEKIEFLKKVATTLKRVETQEFQYQTYLVKTSDKKPVGYVSWGFTVTTDVNGPRVSAVAAPSWSDGVDKSVWGKK